MPKSSLPEPSGDRVIHEYDVPASIGGDITQIAIIELKASEELQATRRARGDSIRLAWELAKQSLYEVNGERVQVGDGSSELAWNRMNPKLRNMTLLVFGEHHAPEEDTLAGFRESRRTRTV